MRWAVLLGLLLTACESRYGAYITVDGQGHMIGFDRVELYFGYATSETSFGGPNGPAEGTVYVRAFSSSDIVAVPHEAGVAPSQVMTYWVPDSEKARALGTYVVAVAYDSSTGDGPVAVGELTNFVVDGETVNIFDVDLVPYNQRPVQPYGIGDPSCLFVPGSPPTAIVRDEDSDCDGQIATADCNDTCSAASPVCPGDVVCRPTLGCSLGCANDTTCSPRTCVPEPACDPLVCNQLDTTQRLLCAMEKTPVHMEIALYTDTAVQPCTQEFNLAVYNIGSCRNPRIEAQQRPLLSDFEFDVQDDGATCRVRFRSANDRPFDFDLNAKHHALISFEAPDGGPRVSFIVGVAKGERSDCSLGNFGLTTAGEIIRCK